MFQRGAEVHVLPWDYDYSQEHFDGIFLSNGPGDPALATDAVTNLRKVKPPQDLWENNLALKG